MPTKSSTRREPTFNIRLDPDEHMQMGVLGRHLGLETKAAVFRLALARLWNENKADIQTAQAERSKLDFLANRFIIGPIGGILPDTPAVANPPHAEGTP